MSRRPNFLLFITDQQRADHLGCAGEPLLRTPTLDRLAREGVRGLDVHVATPICQPNRASLMTGRMPSAHGLTMNGRELALEEFTFVEGLRQAGYRTALAGKAHLQNITPVPPLWPGPGERRAQQSRPQGPGPYGQEIASRWLQDPAHELVLPYYGFERVALTIGHGDQQAGHWRRWLREHHPQAESWIGPENALPSPGLQLAALQQAWRTRLPEALHPTQWIADQATQMLADQAGSGQPFFMQVSFPDPHHPFTPPGRFFEAYRPEDVRLPESFHAALHDPIPPMAHLREQLARRPAGFRPGYGSFACTEQEAREAIALNHGNLAFIDQAMGQVMQQLRSLGLDSDTVVIFTSDHGDLLGERGLLFKGGLHVNALTRVPFIWRDPQGLPPERAGQTVAALGQTIDIAPTVLARAGLPPVHGMQGQSLLGVLAGTESGRDALLMEEESQRRDFGLPQRLRMRSLRTARHRLTVYEGQPWGELIDLAEDPLELRNLWNDPAAQGQKAELLMQLSQAMLRATDECPYPEQAA